MNTLHSNLVLLILIDALLPRHVLLQAHGRFLLDLASADRAGYGQFALHLHQGDPVGCAEVIHPNAQLVAKGQIEYTNA